MDNKQKKEKFIEDFFENKKPPLNHYLDEFEKNINDLNFLKVRMDKESNKKFNEILFNLPIIHNQLQERLIAMNVIYQQSIYMLHKNQCSGSILLFKCKKHAPMLKLYYDPDWNIKNEK